MLGFSRSSQDLISTERVSVDFGLYWTFSDLFLALRGDLPQHFPQQQFSSVNSTEEADQLQRNRSRVLTYSALSTVRHLTRPRTSTPPEPPAEYPTDCPSVSDAQGNQTQANRTRQHPLEGDAECSEINLAQGSRGRKGSRYKQKVSVECL